MKVKGRTKSDNRLITFRGTTGTLQYWSRTTGIDRTTIATRLNYGWPVKAALTVKPGVVHSKRQVTHCPKGHPYDDENTQRTKRGKYTLRSCKACKLERTRIYHREHHEEILVRRRAVRAKAKAAAKRD